MQDEVNHDYSEQNEVDGMKKGADTGIEETKTVCMHFCRLQKVHPDPVRPVLLLPGKWDAPALVCWI